jgi:hypothetical protein
MQIGAGGGDDFSVLIKGVMVKKKIVELQKLWNCISRAAT